MLIVNAKSRRGAEWFDQARRELTARGVQVAAAHPFKRIDEIIARTRRAIDDKAPLVIVGGGDGTFSAVAKYFLNSESILGVLPLGTGNAFARDLGINADIPEASHVIATGKLARVDLGTIDDDFFLNVSTLGVTTGIARELTVDAKRKLGRFVYAVAIWRAIANAKPFHVTIETEHGTVDFDTLQVVLGNGRFHAGPFPIAPDASICEGKLSLYALMSTRKIDFIRYAMHLPGGHHIDLPDVHFQHTQGGTLTTVPIRHVTIDGEIADQTPAKFGVLPRVLPVLVPQEFDLG